MLIVHVGRDEEIQEKIDAAIQDFVPQLEAAYTRLCELNGGPPKRTPFIQYAPKPPAFVPTTQDIPS